MFSQYSQFLDVEKEIIANDIRMSISMNIFILDNNIEKCARYHCDQHVVKMILESVQILCTALNKKGMQTPYRSTHVKHP